MSAPPPSARPKRPPQAVSLPLGRSRAPPTKDAAGWFGAASPRFLAPGLSLSFAFFFRAPFLSLPRFSRSAIRRITRLALTPSFSRSTASGWTALPIASLLFMHAVRISAAPRIGRPAKTNSSVPATAAATTAKGSTSRVRRRARWIGLTFKWRPTDRSLWILRACIPGPRDNRAISMIPDHIWQCSDMDVLVAVGLVRPTGEAGATGFSSRRERGKRERRKIAWAADSSHGGRQTARRGPKDRSACEGQRADRNPEQAY